MNPADELVDLIDDAGHTIGVVTRREMRQKRLPHRCVYLLVFNTRGELFIHQRTATKDVYPAHWDVTISGVLAAGEDFDAGAVREAREEIGVDVQPARLFRLQYADRATVAHGMVYRAIHDGPFCLQVEEIVRGEFVPLEDLPNRIRRDLSCPDGQTVLAEYLRREQKPIVDLVTAAFTEQAVADKLLPTTIHR